MKQQRPSFWLRLWRKVHPAVPDFLGMAIDQCDSLSRALDLLEEYLVGNRVQQAAGIRDLVNESHDLAQRNLDVLHSTFVTPIDREDIYAIITGIDHVFDYVTTAVREIEMLEVPGDRWMQAMIRELQQGTAALKQGFQLFRSDPSKGGRQGDEARRAERHVEELYRQALREMFDAKALAEVRQGSEPASSFDCLDHVVALMKRREVYRHLSNGADRLAHVGELLHDLGVKYD